MDIQKFDFEKIFGYKKKGLIILLLTALLLWLAVDIFNNIKESKYIGQATRNTITVQGDGEIYASPDLAMITASVITEKKTVAEALSANAEKMNGVIEFLKEQGIEDKDLKTTGFNIYPRYEYYEYDLLSSYRPEGQRVLIGYEVTQSLEVKIRNLETVGDIVQGVADNGANQVSSLQFVIENEDGFREQAREQAIAEAKEKAGKLASQLGINLEKIVNFYESGSYRGYYAKEESISAMGGSYDTAPSIETGQNKIEVTVEIVYEIN
jgi:hypothetical protein